MSASRRKDDHELMQVRCCQSGYTCEWADWAQTYVGCCPPGGTCQKGSINQYVPAHNINASKRQRQEELTEISRNSVQTVTVYVTQTEYVHGGGGPPTNVVVQGGQQQQTTTVNNGGGGVVIVGTTTAPVTYGDFCTTIFAQNVDEPTRAAVPCGVALVVSGAESRSIWHALNSFGAIWISWISIIMILKAGR